MTGKGVLIIVWEWFFGAMFLSKCFAEFCTGKHDPRCGGGNCTRHCNEHCQGLCSSRSVVPGNIAALNGMGHDVHCLTIGLQHMYACKSCRFRLAVPFSTGTIGESTRQEILKNLDTCDATRVREVMES